MTAKLEWDQGRVSISTGWQGTGQLRLHFLEGCDSEWIELAAQATPREARQGLRRSGEMKRSPFLIDE